MGVYGVIELFFVEISWCYSVRMDTRKFYRDVLGIEKPWKVQRVDYSVEEQEVHVYLTDAGVKGLACPDCGEVCRVYDHQGERVWWHLDTMQMSTYLHAPVPRVDCKECGAKVIKFPWSDKHARFTQLFECRAIDVLKKCSKSDTSEVLKVSWDEIDGITNRAVKRGLARKETKFNKRLAVDETSERRGHNYLTIVTSHEDGAVEFVGEGRKQETLDEYYQGLSEAQKQAIEVVSMDMWNPYIANTRHNLPDGEEKIVFDKFHVMRLVNKAVDKVRRAEHRMLMQEDDETLKRTKYLWLYNPDNIPDHRLPEFKTLKSMDLKVSRAWAMKESLRRLWSYTYIGAARNYFRRWYFWATHSRLQPFIDVARSIKRRLDNILLYCKIPVTNAIAESVNAKIQHVKRMAHGFRNTQNFKNAIYFHCGNLELYPL